ESTFVPSFRAAYQLDPRFGGIHQATIRSEIVESHASSGKTCLKLATDRFAVQSRKAVDHANRTDFILYNKAGQAIIADFGVGPAVTCNHPRTAGHRLDHDKPERFRPVDWQEESHRAAEKIGLLVIADLTDVFDERTGGNQRTDQFVIVFLIG